MLENDHFGGNWSFSNMSNSSLEFAKSGSSVIKWVSEADLCLFPHIGRNCPAAQVRHLHKGVKPTSRPENTMCVVTHWFGNFRSQWKFWLESSCSDNSADHVYLYLHHVHLSCRLPLPCRACSCGMQMQMEKCGMCSFFVWDEQDTGYLVFWTIFLWANDTQSIKYIRCRLWIYFLLNWYKQIILCFCAHNLQCLCVYLSAWCILYLS